MHTHSKQMAPGRFSSYLALISLLTVTLFFILNLLFPDAFKIIFAGYLFVRLAMIVNSLTLLYLIYQFAVCPFYRETIGIRILILLSNIPVYWFI